MPDSTITPPLDAGARDGAADTRRPSYPELRHTGFVNWYAFFKEDIRIDGRTAILGHNGAGKSAILDALQTVLTGNDRSRLRLNASVQNDEIARVTKSRRSVRDYCLARSTTWRLTATRKASRSCVNRRSPTSSWDSAGPRPAAR
ncbi:hypothetical protein TSH100_00625 [Azospirillum sp. TSH100]|uniref:ATP-binding protein n=1 Tax=Azospirillum sp. TSH100 TaxID=652764 RepID=UPI000D60F17D|nr:ATP-binding protein [Azospirillum sp. TSH100]PWC91423.1 hypothetical protein TSH100_00625 [Azospirillum sp. TSH100]QCG89151.1 ATP-binding cassette domain-containing protein [Azospirillum sp. TSH100]